MAPQRIPNIKCVGKSDVGLKRPTNEDVCVVKPELGFCVVADGMGGAAAGEVASRIFAETAIEVFSAENGRSEDVVLNLVQTAFAGANEKILSHARSNPSRRGMGCTGELVAFYDESYILGHVGDSRAYLLRREELKQLTKDHSVVQQQVDAGMMTASEGRNHPSRHMILRAVGVSEELAPDIVRGKVISGDLLLLCSDGLTDMLEDRMIQTILDLDIELSEKADHLVERAKLSGGLDNITAVLCEVG
jgi:serine/threonine protein phosphatase PrpC